MLTIGADMGGSKTDLICVEGDVVTTARGPGVNVGASPPYEAAEMIRALLPRQLPESVRMCVGAAGAGSEQAKSDFRRALAHVTGLPQEHIQVITDAEAALRGAFNGESGAVVIAGTGSGCYAFDERGTFRRTGGWGPAVGDPASGHSIGRRAIQAALEDLERGMPTGFTSAMVEAVAAGSQGAEKGVLLFQSPTVLTDLIQLAARPAFRPSELAPVILDLAQAGNETARTIITHECRELALQCARLFAAHGTARITKRIALIGGLTSHSGFREALTSALQTRIADCTVDTPIASPAHGALQVALSMP